MPLMSQKQEHREKRVPIHLMQYFALVARDVSKKERNTLLLYLSKRTCFHILPKSLYCLYYFLLDMKMIASQKERARFPTRSSKRPNRFLVCRNMRFAVCGQRETGTTPPNTQASLGPPSTSSSSLTTPSSPESSSTANHQGRVSSVHRA